MLFFNHIRQAISSPKEKFSRISFFYTVYYFVFEQGIQSVAGRSPLLFIRV